ncbi:MAG: FAD-dependent monooxygenase [Streptosporangiaceae bacterium]|nr:FAD-dependent monooxygenase [Streptosporangiaceae bacterium]
MGSLDLPTLRDPVVCVVGAGPAGLVTAHLLRQAGVSFVVLERQEAGQLRARVKAGMIEHRTVEMLRPYGLADPILRRAMRVGMCEFRADGQAFVLDYAERCGGRAHYIYPQHELVADWAGQLAGAGGDVRFGVEATGIEQSGDGVVVTAMRGAGGAGSAGGAGGESMTVECEAVAVCDGAASVLSAADIGGFSAVYPTRWLTLIAATPPSDATIYGLHARGFAGQMHRSATMTRFMLEVPAGEDYGQWDDERIWAELELRLAAAGRPEIRRGEFLERDILDHRVRVCDPMQYGRVFLAGDAAHLITPAGGKGMNIAIQDAVELASGLSERYGDKNDGRRLERYSQERLPSIWRHQEFSNLMLSLFNAGPGGGGGGGSGGGGGERDFSYGLRRARLDLIMNDPRFSRWFAHAYVGVDE